MNKLTPSGINHQRQRKHNRGLIFQLLSTEGNMTRSELAEKSGLTKMTLSNIIFDFLNRGYVVEYTDNDQTPSPYNPAKIALSSLAPKVIGLMIHRTHVAVAFCDLRLNVIESRKVMLNDYDESSLMQTVISLTDQMLSYGNILGIGIAAIGPLDIDRGIILNPPDFCNLQNISVMKYFEHYNLPVYMNHHLNCDALAERYFGNGRKYHDFIFLSIDKDINLGIVSNNNILSDNTGFSSEIGRVLVNYSRPIINREYLNGLGDYVDFTKCAGDPHMLYNMIDILATVLSGICDILNPQAIILGGEQTILTDEHFERFEKVLNNRIVISEYRHIDVLKAFRTQDLEASSSAMNVIQKVFLGQLLV